MSEILTADHWNKIGPILIADFGALNFWMILVPSFLKKQVDIKFIRDMEHRGELAPLYMQETYNRWITTNKSPTWDQFIGILKEQDLEGVIGELTKEKPNIFRTSSSSSVNWGSEQHSLIQHVTKKLEYIFRQQWKDSEGEEWVDDNLEQRCGILLNLGSSCPRWLAVKINAGDPTSWDITILALILNNFVWTKPFTPEKKQAIKDIKDERNFSGHTRDENVDAVAFHASCTKVVNALGVLGCDRDALNRLVTSAMGQV